MKLWLELRRNAVMMADISERLQTGKEPRSGLGNGNAHRVPTELGRAASSARARFALLTSLC
jgi:hypothetical protein